MTTFGECLEAMSKDLERMATECIDRSLAAAQALIAADLAILTCLNALDRFGITGWDMPPLEALANEEDKKP